MRAMKGIMNVPVMDDINYAKTMDSYKSKMQKHEAAAESWEENNLKDYSLVLEHCPNALEGSCKIRTPGSRPRLRPAWLGF